MTTYRVTADPEDGGPSTTVQATSKAEARQLARAELSYGWRIGRLDVMVVADATPPASSGGSTAPAGEGR